MTQKKSVPAAPWYHDGDLSRTVQNARSADVDTDKVVSVLGTRMFNDIRPSRIEAIVEAVPHKEQTNNDAELQLSQPPATDVSPRGDLANQCSVDDIAYLSPREAARLLGLTFELFDGNSIRLADYDGVNTDLLWRRQRMTVVFKIIPTTATVGPDQIAAMQNGAIVPDEMQSPSEVAVVTSGKFTDDALSMARDSKIHCFDAGHVEAWLRRAKLPQSAVGTVLEGGETHDGPMTELVDIPPVPSPRKSVDPLEMSRAFDIEEFDLSKTQEGEVGPRGPRESSTQPAETGTGKQTTDPSERTRKNPLSEGQSERGETGKLYADPDEDGDYDAFDDYLNDL